MLRSCHMPSHLAHTVFARHAFEDSGLLSKGDALSPFAVLGAQGPDIFYHNRRSKPSGLHYGGLLHRKGYGSFLGNTAAFLKRHADSNHADSNRDDAFAYIAAAATHAVLDRAAHPFINYFAGWHRPGADEMLRFTHAFLERLIDYATVKRFRRSKPAQIDFAGMIDLGPALPTELERAIRFGLRSTFSRSGRDSKLSQRLANSYHDAMGFYRFTNMLTADVLRERIHSGVFRPRALTIVHPPWLPDDIDFLNEKHREWLHPCDEDIRSTESFWDLYTAARYAARDAVGRIGRVWKQPGEHATREVARAVRDAVGDVNLTDGLYENTTCRRVHSDPLPLPQFIEELYDRLKAE